MFSFDKKIITADQLRAPKVKNSAAMKKFEEMGGAEIIHREAYVKQFWQKMRADSGGREVGEKGFTKKNLEQFFGKMLNDKKDHLIDKKVRKIADLYGLKRSNIINYAAAERQKEHAAKVEQLQARAAEKKQQEVEFRSHISALVKKGSDKARASVPGLQPPHGSSESGRHVLAEEKEDIKENRQLPDFEVSNKNIRRAEQYLLRPEAAQRDRNYLGTCSHLLSLKNKSHVDAAENSGGIQDAKAQLARIQGRADDE